MGKDSFVFHSQWSEILSQQPPEIRLEVYDGIMYYARTRILPDLSPFGKLAFSFIKADMDKDFTKYDAICERNRKNGKSGGRPCNNPVEPKKPSGLFGNPKNPEKETETEKENNPPTPPIKEKEKEKERGEQTGVRKISTRERQLMFLSEINVNPDFLPIMKEWLEFKADKRQTFTSKRGVKACYNKLIEYSDGNATKAKAIIEQSIANNWAGLFELKQNNNGTNNKQRMGAEIRGTDPTNVKTEDYFSSFSD